MKDAQEMQEENKRVKEQVREMEEKLRKEEKRRLDKWAKKLEEESKRRVNEETYLRQEAERCRAAGIPPVIYPTGDEYQAVREKLKYDESNVHFAITGVSGGGKSSLINAFRGLRGKHQDAAMVGTCETTKTIGRYIDPARPWAVWYDVPGAGTSSIPSWQYFNDQGLYIFDVIIIAIDIRFTEIDLALLSNCMRFGIPAFVVRSKADQNITNELRCDDDDGSGNDDNDDEDRRKELRMKARNKYITNTRQEYQSIFQEASLPQQKVYIVSDNTLRRVIRRGPTSGVDIIDELELLDDISQAANARSYQNRSQPI